MIGAVLGAVAGPLIKGVTGIFSRREERKAAKEGARAKLALAKEQGERSVTLTDAEWETVAAEGLKGSWKDEWVTIVFTAPVPMILAGAVYQAFTGDVRLLEGTIDGIEALGVLGVDFGDITLAVVLAAIGLKVWRAR